MLTLEDQIVVAIRRIIRAVDIHSRRLVQGHGLTGPQLAVLQEISRCQSPTPSQLAKSVHLSQATVTGILKRLEQRQLVAREPSAADRRSIRVRVTEAGALLLEHSPSLLQDRFQRALLELREWERLQILSTLQRIAHLMDADDLDASPHLTPGEIKAAAQEDESAESKPTPTADDSPHGDSPNGDHRSRNSSLID